MSVITRRLFRNVETIIDIQSFPIVKFDVKRSSNKSFKKYGDSLSDDIDWHYKIPNEGPYEINLENHIT